MREDVLGSPAEVNVENPIKQLVTLPPPGIYGQEDRKAGTGGGPEPMAELARAIQQQTSELATLVKAQNETVVAPSGSMKSLGRASEELVFPLASLWSIHGGDWRWRIWCQPRASPLVSSGKRVNQTPKRWIQAEGDHQVGHWNCRTVFGERRRPLLCRRRTSWRAAMRSSTTLLWKAGLAR